MNSASAWSSEPVPIPVGNEWQFLPAGTYTFDKDIAVSEKNFAKQVFAGAMATESELDEAMTIIRSMPEQMADLRAELEAQRETDKKEILAQVSKDIEKASQKAYWKGFRDGAGVILVAGTVYYAAKNF